jgi:hypothetical protein
MKAVWLEEFGGPEVLVAADTSDPVPGPGQALIEVSFANITFVETMFRASGFGPFETELPMIPGNGIGGVVASVGVETDEQAGGCEHRRFGRRRRRIRFRAARPWWPNGPFRSRSHRVSRHRGQDAARYLTSEDTAPDWRDSHERIQENNEDNRC